MTAAAGFLGYAALLVTTVAPALGRASWPGRAPRLAIAGWFALSCSALVSVILAGLAVAPPATRIGADLTRLLTDCLIELRAQSALPGGAALAAGGTIVAIAVSCRVCWSTARIMTCASRARRRHRLSLGLVGRPDHHLGAVIVEHCEPGAYCLPGAGRTVVLTTAALAVLSEAQLAAVLAHERAHQRGRHHLLVSLAASLAAAFPPVRAFRAGREEVARLVELLADDAAAAAFPRLTVAEALLTIGAGSPGPVAAAALGAGGTSTAARVRRLIAAPAPLSRGATAAAAIAMGALIIFPAAILAAAGVSSAAFC